LLLDQGADINRGDKAHAAALLRAVESTHYDLARALIIRGATYPAFNEKKNSYVSASINRLFADHFAVLGDHAAAVRYYRKAQTLYDKAADKYTEIATMYRKQAQTEALKKSIMVALSFWAETEQARLQTRQFRNMTAWTGVKSHYVAIPNHAMTATLIGTRKNTLLMSSGDWEKDMNAYLDRETIPLQDREKYFLLHATEARTLATESRVMGQCHRAGGNSTTVSRCIARGLKAIK
jgi:tetratricopeptide (TPR) repeat protein